MATFEDFNHTLKEPIQVDSRPDRRWTPQKVKFINNGNLFCGTFRGNLDVVSADLSNVNLHNCTIYDLSGGVVNVDELIARSNRLSDLESDISVVQNDVAEISVKINGCLTYKGRLQSDGSTFGDFKGLFNHNNERLCLDGKLSVGNTFQYVGDSMTLTGEWPNVRLGYGDTIIITKSTKIDYVDSDCLDHIDSQDSDVIHRPEFNELSIGIYGTISQVSGSIVERVNGLDTKIEDVSGDVYNKIDSLDTKIEGISVDIYGKVDGIQTDVEILKTSTVKLSGGNVINGFNNFTDNVHIETLSVCNCDFNFLSVSNLTAQNATIKNPTFDDDAIRQSSVSGLTSELGTLNEKVEFLLSVGHDSMEYKGNLVSVDHHQTTLTCFLSQRNMHEEQEKNRFFKNGFLYRIAQEQPYLSDDSGRSVSFGKNDFILFNQNVRLSSAMVSSFEIIRDNSNNGIKVNSSLSSENGLSVITKMSLKDGEMVVGSTRLLSSHVEGLTDYVQNEINEKINGLDSTVSVSTEHQFLTSITQKDGILCSCRSRSIQESDIPSIGMSKVTDLDSALSGISSEIEKLNKKNISCFVLSSEAELYDLSDLSDFTGGTVAIVSSYIPGTGLEQRKAFVWNRNKSEVSGHWEAFTGNYNARNVYFDSKFTMAGDYTNIGNIKKGLVSDVSSYDAVGKSVFDVFNEMFLQDTDDATVKNPELKCEVSLPGYSVAQQEVGRTVKPTYKLTTTYGSYTYGSLDGSKNWSSGTGVQKITLSASDLSGYEKTDVITSQGFQSDSQFTLTDETQQVLSGYYRWSDGNTPATKAHNESKLVGKIVGSDLLKTANMSHGNRFGFFGYRTNEEGPIGCYNDDGSISRDISKFDVNRITSDDIRLSCHAFEENNFFVANGDSASWPSKFKVKKGMEQLIFAIPLNAKDIANHKYIKVSTEAQGKIEFKDNGKLNENANLSVSGYSEYKGIRYGLWIHSEKAESFAQDTEFAVKYSSSVIPD